MPQPSTSDYNRRKCRATNKDGQPCRAAPGPDGFCFSHSPALASKRAAAREQGGHNSAELVRVARAMPADMADVLDVLKRALADVDAGKMDRFKAGALATVARAMCAVYQAAVVDERLQKLERAITRQGDDDDPV